MPSDESPKPERRLRPAGRGAEASQNVEKTGSEWGGRLAHPTHRTFLHAFSHQSGFTLLEVLVAFVIAGLALGLLFEAAGTGMTAVQTAGRTAEAVSRARSHLAAVGRDVSLAGGTYRGDDGDGFQWRIRVTPLATSTPPDEPPPGGVHQRPLTLFAIEVILSWTENGHERAVTLRSQRLTAARAR